MLVNIPPRPNRIDPEGGKKDKDYHVQYARWAIGNFNIYQYQNFVSQYLTNTAFYKGFQWIFEEDLEAFLTDESGEARNRIKWVQNIVKPFVEYFRGSAIKMDLNAEVISISRESKNRRDKALDNVLYWSRLAQKMQGANPQLAQQIQQQMQVPPDPDMVSATFKNIFIDDYVLNMNYFLKYVSQIRNNLDQLKPKIAEDLALAGLAVQRNIARNGEQIFTRTAPERFIFDTTCEYPDFRDAEFLGEFEMRSAADIFEEYQHLSYSDKLDIEKCSLSNVIGIHNIISFYINYAQKLPAYRMHWRDIELDRHGAFYDQYGYPVLEKIDEKHTMNELIPVEELKQFVDDYSWIKTVLNKETSYSDKNITTNNAIVATDVCRFCDFIPGEFVNSPSQSDIVLDYGILPYTQKYSYRHEWIQYPYSAYAYSLILGEIMAPITTLIDPQRMINRVNSVAESHINNSRGSGTVIDKDVVDAQGGEEEVIRNMNLSKPIFVNGQRQINNAVGNYDATIKQGTLTLYDIAERMKTVASSNFGGGENLIGNVDAVRASSSVGNQNITQAVAMQEPFFYGIEQIYFKSYNQIVTRGKSIYTQNSRELAVEIGDEGVMIFKLSSEYDIEEFRAKVVRAADKFTERDAARNMLFTFFQMKMIDQQTFSKYFGDAELTMQRVAYALREYTGLMVENSTQQAMKQPQIDSANMQQALVANEMQSNREQAMQDRKYSQDASIQASKNNTDVVKAAIMASGRDKNSQNQ